MKTACNPIQWMCILAFFLPFYYYPLAIDNHQPLTRCEHLMLLYEGLREASGGCAQKLQLRGRQSLASVGYP